MRGGSMWSSQISKLKALSAIFAVWALLGVGTTYAQVTTGTILGNVTDSSGAEVAGATVTATNELTGFARSVTTGARRRVPDSTLADWQQLPVGSAARWIQTE